MSNHLSTNFPFIPSSLIVVSNYLLTPPSKNKGDVSNCVSTRTSRNKGACECRAPFIVEENHRLQAAPSNEGGCILLVIETHIPCHETSSSLASKSAEAWIFNILSRFMVVTLFVATARKPSSSMTTAAGYLYPRADNAEVAAAVYQDLRRYFGWLSASHHCFGNFNAHQYYFYCLCAVSII